MSNIGFNRAMRIIFQWGTINLMLSLALTGAQGQVFAPAVSDTFIDSNNRDANFCSATIGGIGHINGVFQVYLVQFDISQIPIGTTVDSAELILHREQWVVDDGAQTFAIWMAENSWTECQTTWNDAPFTISDSRTDFSLSGQGTNSTITISLTSIARRWIEQGESNYGIIIGIPGGVTVRNPGFVSVSTNNASNQNNRPRLAINVSGPDLDEPELFGVTYNHANKNLHIDQLRWCNTGSGAAGNHRTGIFLSTNSTISMGDQLLDYCFAGGMGSGVCGDCVNFDIDLSPYGLSPGTYWIGACSDYQDVVAESNENNNCSPGIPIEIPGDGGFLRVEPESLKPETTRGKQAPADTIMICNDGDEAIFFDVVDNAPWITPVEPIDRIVMPGECVEVSINYFGPTRDSGRLPDGTYTKAVVGVKATNATNSPIKIPVTLTVHLPILELNPERPDFIRIDAREGGPVVIGELFAYNPGSGTFDFIIGDNAFWLEVLPSSPGNDRILSHDETESIRFQCNPGSLAARASPYGPATIVVKPRGAKAKRVDVLMYIMP